MHSPFEEILLNKLLNEMDGLREDADILHPTSNRPERWSVRSDPPGRIDQAIEFPLPDEMGREKLMRLYAGPARRTTRGARGRPAHRGSQRGLHQGADAAHCAGLFEKGTAAALDEGLPVERALEQMIFSGSCLLNLKLLGGAQEMAAG